jgi:2-polyprenyl-6-methoxyphenol hydroxylase-like FAD-dependent oxidoreductase
MAESKVKCNIDTSKPVFIIGAGVVGLTLAQGCREVGIPFQIYEQQEASTERNQGWVLTLHWSLNSLERTIGPELSARLFTEVSPSRQFSLAKQY